ncbi:MAG: hypothetical protein QOJ80_3392, partial [Mycobacterium sp.]|nr:hypothetical protein [Mycobacterium sp.]
MCRPATPTMAWRGRAGGYRHTRGWAPLAPDFGKVAALSLPLSLFA